MYYTYALTQLNIRKVRINYGHNLLLHQMITYTRTKTQSSIVTANYIYILTFAFTKEYIYKDNI